MKADNLQFTCVNLPGYRLQGEMARCFAKRVAWRHCCDSFAMNRPTGNIDDILFPNVISYSYSRNVIDRAAFTTGCLGEVTYFFPFLGILLLVKLLGELKQWLHICLILI